MLKHLAMIEERELVGVASKGFHQALGADDNSPELLQLKASLRAPKGLEVTSSPAEVIDSICDEACIFAAKG